ncbi:type-2 histone deacetylase 1 isoform X2 [Drosophila grimshawi]|uniref:type-2 histone deacetylase 1 isoform X2 n=1 Tax=Drosophila grimshawi TaxID=7222 RepID=UPI0013EEEA4F|nr:type-2 histone deacetylase 1 isoform X2 [Drosophila grimshawi]
MFIIPILFVHILITNVLSRFKRKLNPTKTMSDDLDELFLSPIPAPTPVELQQCILFGFRRRLNPAQILDECCNAFGPFAPSASYVARWYQRFQEGLFTIDDRDDDDDDDDKEWCGGGGGGRDQTPTTCSDYNDYVNDNDNDHGLLPLVLHDMGLLKDSYDNDVYNEYNDYDHNDNDDADDDDDHDGHVISYWHGYGYLGGKHSGMSISGLPPLPKSLSGFNKLLGSDSGLLSDVEAQQELENSNNNNNDNNKENESGNKLASQIVSDNKSNNNNLNSDKQASKDSSSKDNANDKSATATAESASLTTTTTPTTATTNLAANASKNENNSTTTTTTTAATATTIITTTKATTTAPSSPAKINVTGSTLDAQIATLRKEMYGLRQLDLSLLSQLWALNDSIQEFRTMIEEQDDEEDDDGDVDVDVELDEQGNRRHSPTPSSYDSVSSEGGVEDADLVMQAKAKRLGTIPKVITTQPKHQQQQQLKSDVKPVPRMRSAPPPPPPVALVCTARKAAAPPRPT